MELHTFNHARPDFAPYGFTCELWTPAPTFRSDRHNEIELNLLKRGSLTILLGGERVTVRKGGLCAFWAAIPHRVIGSEGSPEYYVVTLPLAWFLQFRLPEKLVNPLLHGQCLSDPGTHLIELDIQVFQRWERDLSGAHPGLRQATLYELHARLLRLAEELPDGPATRQTAGAVLGESRVDKGERMAAHIAQHYQEPLSIDEVARAVGLHPNYAMSLFKRTFHITVVDYLTQYRIAHAQRLLATTDEKIIDVALDSGYRTLSRFYEAFGKSCGSSPSQYRKEHLLAL